MKKVSGLQAEAKVPVVAHRLHFLSSFRIKARLVSPVYRFVIAQHPQLAAQTPPIPPPPPPGGSVHHPTLSPGAGSGQVTLLRVLGADVAMEAGGRGEPLSAL